MKKESRILVVKSSHNGIVFLVYRRNFWRR